MSRSGENHLSVISDPWQALYLFRGARPDVVPDLLTRTGVETLPLTSSFRWRTDEQRDLASTLRQGRGVVLPTDPTAQPDVVLALWWKDLWDLGPSVLPLAFGSFKGGYEEAAATLLLNHVTRNIFDLDATYLADALASLDVQDLTTPQRLEPELQGVVDVLTSGAAGAVNSAYSQLVTTVGTVSRRALRPAHAAHTKRLAQLQERLTFAGRPTPGLTTHQAKGGEWDVVGVRLRDSERQTLAGGLSSSEDTHRKIYVACTRAHTRTVEIPPVPAAAPARRRPRKAPSRRQAND